MPTEHNFIWWVICCTIYPIGLYDKIKGNGFDKTKNIVHYGHCEKVKISYAVVYNITAGSFILSPKFSGLLQVLGLFSRRGLCKCDNLGLSVLLWPFLPSLCLCGKLSWHIPIGYWISFKLMGPYILCGFHDFFLESY